MFSWIIYRPIHQTKGSKILDVGCGWGLTSIYLAKIFDAKVTASDIDPNVEAFLRLHSSINQCHVKFEAKPFQRLHKRRPELLRSDCLI
ncbi:MAG: methyltransferase domain-containing protein [Porticoccaceae bacterium]